MKTNTPDLSVFVQHSGYGYAGDIQFNRAVETRVLPTKALREIAKKAGGLIVETRFVAQLDDELNYPPAVEGFIPRVRGTFSNTEVDGLRIYIPHPEDRSAVDLLTGQCPA